MIELFDKPENCCGCSACKAICPVSAISFYKDDKGFEYPRIDRNLCVNCGICVRACDFKKKVDESKNAIKIYAAKIKNDEIRMRSSSGGMFTAFSDYFLQKDGVVYGAVHNENLETVHIRAENAQDRDRCIGSKYVQSSMLDVFNQVKKDLLLGKEVFFTGTPCQVAGLDSYLKCSSCPTDKLLTADLVCHGVPSPMMFQEYIRFCETKTKKKIQKYIHRPYAKIQYMNGTYDKADIIVNVWGNLYYSLLMIRSTCLKCKYTSPHRYGDITIGDFWGIEDAMPDFYDEKGVSLLFINTDKGLRALDAVKGNIITRESCLSACTLHNPNLLHPSVCKHDPEKFWQLYHEKGFEAVARRYGGYGVKYKIKRCVRKALEKMHLLNIVRKIYWMW